MNARVILNKFFLTLILSFSSRLLGAQEFNHVEWVRNISTDLAGGGNFLEKITDAIMGSRSYVGLKRPISVLASNPNLLKILDQQNHVIWNYNSKKNRFRISGKSADLFPSVVGICALDGEKFAFSDSFLNEVYVSDSRKTKKLIPASDSLQQPTGLAYSKLKNELWVVETAAHRISVFDKNGVLLKRLGKRGNGELEFNYPTFIWIDDEGKVYVVDAMNFRVQILNEEGEFIRAFGQNGNATGYLARPKGIATDSHGHIYIADALFSTVQLFDEAGTFLFKFGGLGKDNGFFWMPTGIYIDKKDNIYVADTYNARIQVYKLVMNE